MGFRRALRAASQALLWSFLLGCGRSEDPGLVAWSSFNALARRGPIEVHVDPGPAQRAALKLISLLQASSGFRAAIVEAGTPSDPARPRVVIGSLEREDVRRLAACLGVEPLDPETPGAGFLFAGREWRAPGDALVASFSDPEREGLPVVLWLGNDEGLLAEFLTYLPLPWRPSLTVFADGERALSAPVDPSGRPRLDEARDYLGEREAYWRGAATLEHQGITVHLREVPEGRGWTDFLARLVAVRERVQRWLGPPVVPEAEPVPVPVELWLYDRPGDLERLFGESRGVLVNPFHARVHVPWFPQKSEAAQGVARVCARALAGAPTHSWLLDGLAVAADARWWGRPLAAWAGHLQGAGLFPSIPRIVDERSSARLSPHILMPARGLLFEFLVQGPFQRRGRALWAGAPLNTPKVAQGFARRLAGCVAAARKARQRLHVPQILSAPVRHGVALVDERTPWHRSTYATAAVLESLTRAREAGADAFSLTVRAAPRSGPEERWVDRFPRVPAASASDEALIVALAAGRKLGLRPMLSLLPQADPTTTFVDGLPLTGPEEIERFFERFESVALHYALFCELASVEVLCLGSDLRAGSRTAPRPEAPDARLRALKREGWAGLLERVRGAYHGALTYAAHTPGELEEVGFWKDLDFLGVAFFPRIAARDVRPRDGVVRRALDQALEDLLDAANRWNRPLLLVQLGYPIRSLSWSDPSVPHGALEEAEQERFFRLWADTLLASRPDREVLRGFYLWNWPTDGDVASPGEYAVRDRPAEAEAARALAGE